MTTLSDWVPTAIWALFVVSICYVVYTLHVSEEGGEVDADQERLDKQSRAQALERRLHELVKDNETKIRMLSLYSTQITAAEFVETKKQIAVRMAIYDGLLAVLYSNMAEISEIFRELGYPERSR